MRNLYQTFVVIVLIMISVSLMAQSTPGTMTFKVKTETLPVASYPYSPKYVYAVWVTTEAGAFVKTLALDATVRKQHLVAWNAASAGNTTDAVTGATYTSSPTSHTETWNGTNTSSVVVADGNYKVWIETTAANSSSNTVVDGPNYSVLFAKGSSAVHLTPPDQTYFTAMDLTWTPTVAVSAVSVSPKNLSVLKSNTGSLTATVAPVDATNKTVTWTSVDPLVATVNSSGVVTGVGAGTTKVYVKTQDGNFTDTCTVTVTTVAVAVTGVSVNPSSATVVAGKTTTLTTTISPANATNNNVTWTTTDASIATVANGIVTGVKAGSAKIIATTVDGSFKDTCNVTVSANLAIMQAEETGLNIFPNPASSSIELTFNASSAGSAYLQIFLPDGSTEVSNKINVVGGMNSIQLSVDKLSTGFHFISITRDGFTQTKPFIIGR